LQQNIQISNLIKIHPVGTELFRVDRRVDRRTDMTKLLVTFHNLVIAPKKGMAKQTGREIKPHVEAERN